MAVESEFVNREMKIFFDCLIHLQRQKMTIEEVFYHASLIHLRFAHIHPFSDGNGRTARLIEKWGTTTNFVEKSN